MYLIMNRPMVESFTEIHGRTKLNRVDIWEKTKNNFSERDALEIFPKTFLLPRDIDQLMNDPHGQYILKKTCLIQIYIQYTIIWYLQIKNKSITEI